jgi:hypothetical protein
VRVRSEQRARAGRDCRVGHEGAIAERTAR